MRVGIIGAGLIGKKRGEALEHPHEVCSIYDQNYLSAKNLSVHLNSSAAASLDDFFSSNPEVVIIATPHAFLAEYTQKCIEKKIPVLVEKPGAFSVSQLEQLIQLSQKYESVVKVGFNHRFHPAILKAKDIIDKNEIGSPFMIRARYGHGARLGYEKEWRCNPEISGGGELLDQGVHLLDLIYWFLGPLAYHSSTVDTLFWDTNVEDNAVVTLKENKKMATFHVSFFEWKNIFSLEIYGKTGKLLIEGLGKSYGTETLTIYKMPPEMGPPTKEVIMFEGVQDNSWQLDFQNLLDHLEKGTSLLGDLESALFSLKIVRQAYRNNKLDYLPCSV